MPINISDVVVNIGHKTNSVDWFDFYKTILSILLGGLMTYFASKKMKTEDSKKELVQKVALVNYIASFAFNDILIYKREIIDPIRKNLEKENIQSFISGVYIPKNEFDLDYKEYIILDSFNCYLSGLLNKTNALYQLLKQVINTYNDFIKNDIHSKILYKESYVFDDKTYISSFENLENVTNELLLRLYFILKNLNVLQSKYLNFGCIENIEEIFKSLKLEENDELKDLLKSDKYKEIILYQQNLERCWAGQSRFGCTICYIIRRIRHWFKWLKIFFQLPETCKFVNKKNKEEKPTNES